MVSKAVDEGLQGEGDAFEVKVDVGEGLLVVFATLFSLVIIGNFLHLISKRLKVFFH